MPRKRRQAKQTTIEEENDENVEPSTATTHDTSKQQHGPMYTIMSNAQMNETFHKKYIKEMQDLYMKMDHDAFMFTFIKMLKSAMATEETNEYANTTLIFCAKYIASYDGEDTHPVLLATFKWLLSTISSNPHIRYRICQYVNMVLNALGLEAALDDAICDSILGYMINRLKDLNPNVRVQAILALQRLQIPDNPDDVVVKTYQFHLSSDPSPRVRQAVITSMGRNYNTIPYILERLWDVDEKVRRHTYLHMSSYPVKAYKVAQRLTFLEQGLNDRSDMVRKVVTTVMLPQWLESYNKNIIDLVSALKLDANEMEIDRFRKITKIALFEIFKRQKTEFLVATLPLEEEGECEKCIPFDKLSVDISLYWLCLIEYLQNENADELDSIIPELTTFCNYVQKYCESSRSELDMDKWERMRYQYTLLTLMEIVNTFDLGDEIGRENLKILLEYLLKNFEIDEKTIKVIIQCAEKLITKQEDRLQYFVDIVKDITDCPSFTNEISHDRTLIEKLLENHPEKEELKFKISSMKVKILDMEEQETNFVKRKEYAKAQRISEELNALREQYRQLLLPFFNQSSDVSSEASRRFITFQQRKMSPEVLIKALQISFYMVVSKNVKSLTPNVCDLYRDFIRRHVESNQIAVRDWALKCGTAYSMLYEPLSKDVYSTLYSQFYKNHNVRLWKTAIECIFELLDRYSCSHFDIEDKHNKSRKTGRQLYNTQNSTLDSIDAEDEPNSSSAYGVDLIFMMSHFLDTCDDACILSALVNGFCRLVLHGQIKNEDIMMKMLLKYFNPVTDPEINQILGVFFENLIKRKKQEYLQPCLLPTISTIMSAPYDSPLHEIKPENVLRFVIDSTRPIHNVNIHDTLALSFLQEMQNNISNKDLLKILVKELLTLNISNADESSSRDEMRTLIEKLLQCDIDPKTAKYLGNFRDILDGMYQPSTLSVRTTIRGEGSDEENDEVSDDEDENRNIIEENSEKNTNQQQNPNENGLETVAEEPNEDNEENNGESEENNEAIEENNEAIEENNEANEHNNEATKENNEENEKSNESPDEISMQSLQTSQSEDKNEDLDAPQQIEQTPAKEPEENRMPPPPPQQTPTTFGKDNTTRLRYLRKSLNVPQTNLEEPPTKKLRLRNNPKGTDTPPTKRNTKNSTTQSESQLITPNTREKSIIERRDDDETSSSSDKDSSDTSENASTKNKQSTSKKPASAVEKRKSQLDAESADELEPLVVSDDEVINTDAEEEVAASSDDEVVSSPTVNTTTTTASRSRRLAKRPSPSPQKVPRNTRHNKNPSQSRTPATVKSVTKNASTPPNKIMSPAGKEDNNSEQTRRRQRLFVSPQMEKELAEKNARNRRIETPTREKSSNNEKAKSTATIKDLTISAEKRIRTGKNPVLKLNRANKNHQTRSVSKQESLLNNIITRRKITTENSPRRQSFQPTSSPRPVNHDKENVVEKVNSKAAAEKANAEFKTPQPRDSSTAATKQKSQTVEKSKKTAADESNSTSTKKSSRLDARMASRSRTNSVTQARPTRRSSSMPGTRLRTRK